MSPDGSLLEIDQPRRVVYMKIHLKFDESNALGTRFSLIVNGKRCGEVSMAAEEAVRFQEIVKLGCLQTRDVFGASGELYIPENWVLWHKRSGIERRKNAERRNGQDRRSGNDRRNSKT
jgi:hypothetical protein